jgi:uncharacterized protein (TIGR03067 family)
MRRCVLVAAVALLAGGRAPAQAPGPAKPTELEGDWKLVRRVADGQELPAPPLVAAVRGDTHTITRDGRVLSVMKARLDPAKRPKAIDIEVVEGASAGRRYGRGVYELDGDELRICVRSGADWPAEAERPAGLASARGSGLTLSVFRRVPAGYAAAGPPPTQADVVYGRKDGLALTLDVYRPPGRANGAVAAWVLSVGYVTQPTTDPWFVAFHREMLKRGYTVLAVRPGGQPRYTVEDMAADVRRAVRFARHRAADWGADPDRLGIAGVSAGGHLALLAGVAGDDGRPGDPDPVERRSCRVGAAAAYCPPTDFLAFGLTPDLVPRDLRAAFDFRRLDPDKGVFVPVRGEAEVRDLLGRLSPARRVTKAAAPALIIHGGKDADVPVGQSERMVAKLREAGVAAELVVRPGAGHAWKDDRDPPAVGDWFDRHLGKPKPGKP